MWVYQHSSTVSIHYLPGCLSLTLLEQFIVPALWQPRLRFVTEALRSGATMSSRVPQQWVMCLGGDIHALHDAIMNIDGQAASQAWGLQPHELLAHA
jgi:hypothetical protein